MPGPEWKMRLAQNYEGHELLVPAGRLGMLESYPCSTGLSKRVSAPYVTAV